MQDAPPRSPAATSLALRALLAVALAVGFYLLAIGVAALLLGGAAFIAVEGRGAALKIIVMMTLGGLAILWGILPRIDRFTAPGPELSPEKHPRLFASLTRIARATGQKMPDVVYLDPSVNAGVTRRGGILGIGSRPIMVLG